MAYPQPSCAPHLPAAQGALLKEADLVRWLQNKLQDKEKWAGREATQFVSREMVEELQMCFSMVENPTKLKIIHSFLYLTPKLSKAWRESLIGLINAARRDPDDWVEVISELFREAPMAGGIKPTADDIASWKKMIEDLTAIAEEREEAGDLRTDPPSLSICTTEVVKSLFESEPAVQKHFALKKKPKSHALFEEIKKQSEILNSQKRDRREAITSGSLPIKIRSTRREANNTLPMRGIPNQNQVKMSQGFTNEPKKFIRPMTKREGGVKLLDIDELPLSLKQRRQAEREDEQRKAKEEKEQQKKAKEEEKKNMAEAKKQAMIRAKELAAKPIEKKPLPEKAKPTIASEPKAQQKKTEVSNPLKRQASQAEPPLRSPTHPTPEPTQQSQHQQVQRQPNQIEFIRQLEQPLMHQQQPQHQQMQQQPQPQMQQIHAIIPQQIQMQQVPMQQQQPLHHQRLLQSHPQMQRQQQVYQIPQQYQQVYNPNMQRPVIIQNYPGAQPIQIPGTSQVQVQPTFLIAAPQTGGLMEFQDPEVARKCQEILNSANALDERNRNIVIQFMKGSLRCTINPNGMDHIMTLKLSENIEDGLADGRVQKLKVEVFFQMDLSNGEWKRLRKCRLLEGDEMGMMNQQPPQQQQLAQPSWHTQQYQPPRFM